MKKGVTCGLIAFVFIVSSCKRSEDANHNEANIATVKSFYRCFNQHNWVKTVAFYADSSQFLDPCYGTELVIKTRQNLVDRYFVVQKEVPDIKDSVINIFTNDDKIAVEHIITGSLPDGTKLKMPVCDIWAIKNGLFVKDACYYDNR